MNYQMDYFYGHEANQFTFFRIPKLLFSDERFIGLTSDAKILYGLMLDRMGLSVKNGWIDEKNHVYIYFTLEEAMEYMRVGKDKGVKLFAELDDEKGCGLIKKKKQGLGRPTLIYVMNFVSCTERSTDNDFDPSNNVDSDFSETTEVLTSENAEVLTSENPKSALLEIRSPNFEKTEVNNNEFNNNKNNNTEFSDNNHISSYHHRETPKKNDVMDEVDERNEYRDLIAANIEYDFIAKTYGQSSADEVLEIILDAVCSKKDYLWVSEEQIPQVVVKGRLLKLNYSHIEYVLDCMRKNNTKIHNIKSYVFTALYNSYSTMGHYYTAEANYDLYNEREEKKQ